MADDRRAAGPALDDPLRAGLLGAVWVLALAAMAIAAGLDLRAEVAPIGAALSLVLALVLYLSRERSERRRKTLEVAEKQYLDPTLRSALQALRTAVADGSYSEADAASPDSHLAQTTLLLNYLETCCAGTCQHLYDARLTQEFLGPLAEFLIANFLVAPVRGSLPTRIFLPRGVAMDNAAPDEFDAPFPNIRAVFPERVASARTRPSAYEAAALNPQPTRTD